MSPTSVVVVDADAERRRSVAQGLSHRGYEVAPASSLDQGVQYVEALSPDVLLLPAENLADPRLATLVTAPSGRCTVVALGAAEAEGTVPEHVAFVAADGLTPALLLQRLELVLMARELGLETDAEVHALVGQLSRRPLFELLPALAAQGFTGRIDLAGGGLWLRGGRPLAARAGRVEGLKGFCRLATSADGTFRVVPGDHDRAEQWSHDLEALMTAALEDALGDKPNPKLRVRVEIGPKLFSTRFGELQQQILEVARDGTTLGHLLDTCDAPDGRLVEEVLELEGLGVLVLEEPETGVVVVTDSCADLPAEALTGTAIEVVPLTVTFGREVFHDGVDLSSRQFFDRLEKDPEHPFTSPPPRAAFRSAYGRTLGRRDVVSIHISEALSQTVVHAREAAAEILEGAPRERIDGDRVHLEVVDSRQASLPQGMLVLYAARLADRGLPASEIARRIPDLSDRIHSFFVVDTLEFLVRGNRIGRARALIGSLLGIKPILGVAKGEVVPVDKVRGGRNAHKRILDLASGRIDPQRPILAAIAHAKAPVWADRLRQLVLERFSVRELLITEMGPVIGTHVGPGTVGLAVLQPSDEELELLAPPAADAAAPAEPSGPPS
ncbi:MAG: DegV family EDD domain-containing protein [Acidobacteria bacterium]|nr:DegV family EDD domain-containing protein [Acidobacteriota bacterium]